MAEKSPIARIKELDDERQNILTAALSEVKARVQKALEDLKTLGEDFILIPRAKTLHKQARRKTSRKGTRTIKEAACSICGFKTKPPHDARKHRFAQGKKKRPFTAKELSDLGLKKVG